MDEGAKLFAQFDNIVYGNRNSKSYPLGINFTKIYPQSGPVHNRISRLKKYLTKVVELVRSCRDDEETFCLLLEAGLPNLIVESIGVFREVSSLEGVAPLLEELLDTVNLISESGAHGQASMVKSVCGPYLDLLLGDFCSLSQKTEISRALNIILETCPFAVKELLLKKTEIIEKLQHLFQLIITVGDYEFQIGLLECMFRLVPRKVRGQYALKFIQGRFLDHFLDIRDANFETDCRVFLNEVNRTAGNNGRVYSIPCEKAMFGKKKLNKPNDDDYDEFWVDFNYGTRRITLFCEQDVMEVNSQMSQAELDLWETVSVSLGDVKCYSYTEHDNIGISSIELKKDISCLYPNMMQCSGKYFELFVQTKYNPRKALMSVFGSEKCTNRKASSAILPLHLNVQNVLCEETESPLCRRSTHESAVAALQDNFSGSPRKLTPLRTKISVPCIPMSTPARSLHSQEEDQEPVSTTRNIQPIQHARANSEQKTTKTCQPSESHCKKSTFAAPKTPSVRNVRPKVKTPVVTIIEGSSKKLQKDQKIKQGGKQDGQERQTWDIPSDKCEDDIIRDALPTADQQHITTNLVYPKSDRNPTLSDSGIDLTEAGALRRDRAVVLSKDQNKREKDSSFDSTANIDMDFKNGDKKVSQGTKKPLQKEKQRNKTDQNVSPNYQQRDQDAEKLTQSSDCPSIDVNVIQESQYVSTETVEKGSSDVQDTGTNTDCSYSSTVTTKVISSKQKKTVSEKQKKCIQSKGKVNNVNRIEEGVNSESSLQSVPSDVTSQLKEACVKVTKINTLASLKDMKDKNTVKKNTTGKDSATKKKNKCNDKNALANDVDHKQSSFTTNKEVKSEAEHKKALGKTSKQKVKTSGCHKIEEEHANEPQPLEKHCKRILPGRKAKAKQSDVYNEEFSCSENVGNLFESPFSMADDTSKDLHKEPSTTSKMSSYVKPKSSHRLLSQSGLYFPELSSNSSQASDPYDFDMECEEQLHSQFQTNPGEVMEINLSKKQNSMVTSMNTSRFFKHRSEVGINISSETIATNYMKTWHQKLNKKGGKSAVSSQCYTSWKSVDKKSKIAKKENIRKKYGQNSNSKTKQQNYVEETSIRPEKRGSKANVGILKDTEIVQNESTNSLRKKAKNPKFKLFNPDLSMLLPTQDGNAESINIQEENNESLHQEKDQLESTTKERKPKHCDKKIKEEKKTVVTDAPKKKKQSSKSRCHGKASEKLDYGSSSDRYENEMSNSGIIENFSAICESLVDQSSLDKMYNKQDEEHKTSSQEKSQVTKCSDEEYQQDNYSIVNDLKSELSWIARRSTAKKKKSQKTYKRKPVLRERQDRPTDTNSQHEDRKDENSDNKHCEDDDNKDDSEEDNDGGVSDDGDILLIRREAQDLILTQDSDAPARSAKGQPTNVSSVIHSTITPNILQRGTPKILNSKRRYSPLDVKFLSTPKTPKTPGSFQWSDEEDQAESETADIALTQQFEVCEEYSLPLKDHETVPKLLSRCADKMIRSGPSSTVRPSRSALKRKYEHLRILDESESDDVLSSESNPHSDDERSFCPRKLFRKDLPEPTSIANSPILEDKEENISNRPPPKIAQPLKSCPTAVPPFHLLDQQTEDGSSSQNGELDLVMDLGCDSGINTGISTYIQSFGMDMQKQLKVKHQQLTELTRGALRNTQKHIYKIWTSESQDRGRALEHFKDKMLEELLSLEADVTALKNIEERSLIFCQEQLEAMKKHKVSQEIRLRNLKLLYSTLDDNLKECEVNAQSKQLNLKQIMKKDMAALQRKLLLESNQHQISNVKRCLKSMLF